MAHIYLHGWAQTSEGQAETTVRLDLDQPCTNCKGTGTIKATGGLCGYCAGRGAIPTIQGDHLLKFLERHPGPRWPDNNR